MEVILGATTRMGYRTMGMIKTGAPRVNTDAGSIKVAASNLRECPKCSKMVPDITGMCPHCGTKITKIEE
jgi:tRNA G26 N,N-dimethylase Trm1